MTRPDPWSVLGIEPGSDPLTVRNAFRSLALVHHPDTGGDPELMSALIEAYRSIEQSGTTVSPEQSSARRTQRDVSSFTYEALPVVTFENLLVVAGILGDVSDEDPPYMLEFLLRGAVDMWCRCELVPDAGSTTVSITVSAHSGLGSLGVETVRDVLVAELNALEGQ